jgi:hypothetical protein
MIYGIAACAINVDSKRSGWTALENLCWSYFAVICHIQKSPANAQHETNKAVNGLKREMFGMPVCHIVEPESWL